MRANKKRRNRKIHNWIVLFPRLLSLRLPAWQYVGPGYLSIFYLLYNNYTKYDGGMQGKSKDLTGLRAFLCAIFRTYRWGQPYTILQKTSQKL